MRQSFLEAPGGGARSSTGITCDGESANLPSITTAAYSSHPYSYSIHQQPHHVVGGGSSLGMPQPRPDENNQMLKGGDGSGRVPPSAMGFLPTPQQIHLDQHRPCSLPLGIENNMDSEGSSSHSSSLTQDDTLMLQQHPHLREYDETDSASPAHTNSPSTSEGGGSKGFKKRAWTVTEDGTLRDLVEQHGAKDWNYISSQLSHRSAKQCCERWHNYLKPDIRKDAWCTQEDQIILDYHHAFCNKWSKIAEFLPGRTGNAVKNRFYCLMRRDRKNAGAAAGATAGGASPSPTAGGGGAGGGGEMLMPHHGGGRPPLSPHHMQQQQQQQHLQQQQQQQQQQLQLQQLQQGFHGHLQHLPPGHAPSLGLPILTTTVDAQGNHHTQLANGTSIPSSSSSSSSSSGLQQQQQQQQQQPRHPQQQQQQQQQLHYTHSLQSSPTGGQTDIPPWGPSWTPPTTTSTGHHHQQQQQNNISSSGSSSGSSGSSSSGGGGGNAVFFGGNAAHGQHEGEGGGGTYFPHSAYPHHTGTPTEFRFTAAGAQRPTIHLGRGGGGGGQQQQQQQHQHQHQMQFMPMLIPSSASHSNDGGRGGGGGGGEGGDAIMVESNSNQKGGKS